MTNAGITLEVPGIGACTFREFSWLEMFAVQDILTPMGVEGTNVEWVDLLDPDTPEDPARAFRNMRRMFATATVGVRETYPDLGFDDVARCFTPDDPEHDRLLGRIYAITSTGRDMVPEDDDGETAGNEPAGTDNPAT